MPHKKFLFRIITNSYLYFSQANEIYGAGIGWIFFIRLAARLVAFE
jgi:hypothetical protein